MEVDDLATFAEKARIVRQTMTHGALTEGGLIVTTAVVTLGSLWLLIKFVERAFRAADKLDKGRLRPVK